MPDEYPEPESITILVGKGAKIGEMPVEMLPKSTGTSSIQGLQSFGFMIKVLTALIGLKLRTLVTFNSR